MPKRQRLNRRPRMYRTESDLNRQYYRNLALTVAPLIAAMCLVIVAVIAPLPLAA